MKKTNMLLVALFLSILVIIISIRKNEIKDTSIQYKENMLNIKYNMNLSFDEETSILYGIQEVYIENYLKNDIQDIKFHLYPNYYNSTDKLPQSSYNIKSNYPYGFNYGGIEILEVIDMSTDEKLSFTYNDNNTILIINKPLFMNEKTSIKIVYKTTLPKNNMTFGYDNQSIRITNFYPILVGYYDKYHDYPLSKYIDTKIQNQADYEVSFKCGKDYVIAHNATLISYEKKDDYINSNYIGKDIKDFALILSKDYIIKNDNAKKTQIYSYEYTDKTLALEYTVKVLDIMSEVLGNYSNDTYSLVISDVVTVNNVFSSISLSDKSNYSYKSYLEMYIAKNLSKQWWGKAVAINTYEEFWFQEALSQYFIYQYYKNAYSEDKAKEYYDRNIMNSYNSYQDYKSHETETRDYYPKNLYEFNNSLEYYQVGVVIPTVMIFEIESQVGEEIFINSIRELYEKNKGKIISFIDFLTILESKSDGVNIEEIKSRMLKP